MVEAPGVVLRPQQQLAEQAQRRPPDWVAYTDGSEDLGKAGWAYTVLIGGDAIGDEGASLASEGYGPVVTSAGWIWVLCDASTSTSGTTQQGPKTGERPAYQRGMGGRLDR